MHTIPTEADVFDYEVGGFDGRPNPVGKQRWVFMGTHASDQGQHVAELRSVEGGHKATVAMQWLRTGEARFEGWTEADGAVHPARVVARPVTNVETGGAAAVHARFAEHQEHSLRAHKAFDKALRAHATGDAAGAAVLEDAAAAALDAMDAIPGLKLHHTTKRRREEHVRARREHAVARADWHTANLATIGTKK